MRDDAVRAPSGPHIAQAIWAASGDVSKGEASHPRSNETCQRRDDYTRHLPLKALPFSCTAL